MEDENGWKTKEFCDDPWGARQLANVLDDKLTCVEVRQGMQTLSEPTKKFRELVIQGKIVHDGSPLLTWALSNAMEVADDKENIKLSKKHKDDSQRIDPIAAVLNAFTRAYVPSAKPVYETRGMRSLF